MKKKVAFICVHNSCRSQIAEAFGRHFANSEIAGEADSCAKYKGMRMIKLFVSQL